MKLFRLLLLAFLALTLAGLTGCAHHPTTETASGAVVVSRPPPPVSPAAARPADGRAAAEQIRTACIDGRRLVCGKVLKVLPDGLVVESGYTDLLRPPLMESWLVSGTVSATRNTASLELNQPGTPCFGVVFLTDIPKRPKAKAFDYVILMGYPAGEYDYTPVPGVRHTIRKFSAGLDTAVRLRLQPPGDGKP
jgi:hypothetical protein